MKKRYLCTLALASLGFFPLAQNASAKEIEVQVKNAVFPLIDQSKGEVSAISHVPEGIVLTGVPVNQLAEVEVRVKEDTFKKHEGVYKYSVLLDDDKFSEGSKLLSNNEIIIGNPIFNQNGYKSQLIWGLSVDSHVNETEVIDSLTWTLSPTIKKNLKSWGSAKYEITTRPNGKVVMNVYEGRLSTGRLNDYNLDKIDEINILGPLEIPYNATETFFGLSGKVHGWENLNVNNVQDFTNFTGKLDLSEADWSNFKPNRGTKFSGIFNNQTLTQPMIDSLKDVKFTNADGLFKDTKIKDGDKLDFSPIKFNLTNRGEKINAEYFFQNVKGDTLDLSTLNLSNVKSAKGFLKTSALDDVLADSGFITKDVESFESMFEGATITSKVIDLNQLDMSSNKSTARMFHSTKGVDEFIINDWNTNNLFNMANMYHSSSVNRVDISKWALPKVNSMGGMFNNIQHIEYIDISGLGTIPMQAGVLFDNNNNIKELVLGPKYSGTALNGIQGTWTHDDGRSIQGSSFTQANKNEDFSGHWHNEGWTK